MARKVTWLSPKAASDQFGVSQRTLRRYIEDGSVRVMGGFVRESDVAVAIRKASQRMQSGQFVARGRRTLQESADAFVRDAHLSDAQAELLARFVTFVACTVPREGGGDEPGYVIAR